MEDHDDFAQEPIKGLPQALPEGEEILWQGRPDVWALTRDALSIRAVAIWFGLLFLARLAVLWAVLPPATAIASASLMLIFGAAACGILWLLGRAMARLSVYTITNKRIILRIGVALTMTLNIPFRKMSAANLETKRDGTGTIAIQTLGDTRLSYLVLWPHLRPWRFGRTEPALRCIPEAAKVARLLAEVAEPEIAMPEITRVSPAPLGTLAAAE